MVDDVSGWHAHEPDAQPTKSSTPAEWWAVKESVQEQAGRARRGDLAVRPLLAPMVNSAADLIELDDRQPIASDASARRYLL